MLDVGEIEDGMVGEIVRTGGTRARRLGELRLPEPEFAAPGWRIKGGRGRKYVHVEQAGVRREDREVRATLVVNAIGAMMAACGLDVRTALRVLAAVLGVTGRRFRRWVQGDLDDAAGLWRLAVLVERYEQLSARERGA